MSTILLALLSIQNTPLASTCDVTFYGNLTTADTCSSLTTYGAYTGTEGSSSCGSTWHEFGGTVSNGGFHVCGAPSMSSITSRNSVYVEVFYANQSCTGLNNPEFFIANYSSGSWDSLGYGLRSYCNTCSDAGLSYWTTSNSDYFDSSSGYFCVYVQSAYYSDFDLSYVYMEFDYTLSVDLAYLYALSSPDGSSIGLEWGTSLEENNAGWNVYHSLSVWDEPEKVNSSLIPPYQYDYFIEDHEVEPGIYNYYWLEDVETDGASTMHGPVWAVPTALDVDSSARIDGLDVIYLSHQIGNKQGDKDWNQALDVNYDRVIDLLDYSQAVELFGKTLFGGQDNL